MWQLRSSFLAGLEQEVMFFLITTLSNILSAMELACGGNFYADLEWNPLDPPG